MSTNKEQKNNALMTGIIGALAGATTAFIVVLAYMAWYKKKNSMNTPISVNSDPAALNYYTEYDDQAWDPTDNTTVITKYNNKTNLELAQICNSTPGCVAFDSNGSLRNCIDNIVSSTGVKAFARLGTNGYCTV